MPWSNFPVSCATLVLGLVSAAGAAEFPALDALPEAQWVAIHVQQPGDAVTFVQQPHAGSAFDTRRGRLVIFGSDTHGTDWSNAPRIFDPAERSWRRPYPDDEPATYRVTPDGLPVAGPRGDHPWAMHTFGAVAYDVARDAVVVASAPAHLAPGHFPGTPVRNWNRMRIHPTWRFDLASETWHALPVAPVSFFPYAIAYDSDHRVILGYRSSGIYALEPQGWRQVVRGGLTGYGNNAVYDSRHRALVVFGGTGASNDIVVYEHDSARHRRMPTPGLRPPPSVYRPMAFHRGIGRTVVMIDRGPPGARWENRTEGHAETWTYDLSRDAWDRIATARLPFRLYMNFNLEYDPGRNLLYLVATPPLGSVTVWALRLG